MIWLDAFLVAWFGLGMVLAPFSFTLEFAYFQRKWPRLAPKFYQADLRFGIVTAILTIISWPVFVVALILSEFGRYGLKWK